MTYMGGANKPDQLGGIERAGRDGQALPGAFVTPYVAHINHMFRSCYCSIYKAFNLVTSDTGLITSLEKWFFYRHDEKDLTL